MKGKVNKRLDKCIHILLRFTRYKAFQRLIKIEKGKITEKIIARHQRSLMLSTTQVSEIEEDSSTWKVLSSDNTNTYSVSQINKTCPHKCSMQCPDCTIPVCVHMFSCNCADGLIRTTICKHIHLVARKISNYSTHSDPAINNRAENSSLLLKNIQDTKQLSTIALREKNSKTIVSISRPTTNDRRC